jgi:predicted transposase
MKLVANLKLTPTLAQERELHLTLARCNEACNWLCERAWQTKTFRQYDLHKICYQEVRETFELSAQVTIRCIAKVADAYKLDQKTQRTFRKHAAQPYDDRILRFVCDEKVSLWLLSSREKIGYVCGDHQRQLLEHRKGEVDLMLVRGKWYLAAVCDFDDPTLLRPEGVLGVDFGIVNIATDSLGERHCGAKVEAYRERYATRRATLQRLGTRAAKRCLRHISGRQKRFQKYENHGISKRIVSTAERSRLGIGLEDLSISGHGLRPTKRRGNACITGASASSAPLLSIRPSGPACRW